MGIEEEDKKEEKAKPKQGPFDDTMWRKLELDPTTKEYLFDNSFVEKMKNYKKIQIYYILINKKEIQK